jgi:hypothetical protein
MTQVLEHPRPQFQGLHLGVAAVHVFILLCWAGIVPLWRLLPPSGQAVVLPLLQGLYWPALALAALTVVVAVMRYLGVLSGGGDQLAATGQQLAGIAFACLVFKAMLGLSVGALGLGTAGTLIATGLRVVAPLMLVILPIVAVIILVTSILKVLGGKT